MIEALVDGDIPPYKIGYSVEQSSYETLDGEIHATPGAAKKHCKEKGLDVDEIKKYTEAEPLSHALRLVNNLLLRVKQRTGADKVTEFLSGKTNYRDKIATIQPYKGNRPKGKPLHYEAIRKHLRDKFGAITTVDCEADDALSINSGPGTVICTIDKDLNMVPGKHYNWDTDILYDVTEMEGMRSFYTQLLTGDQVDNIRGIPGIGPVKAEKILHGLVCEEDLYKAVSECYQTRDELVENARLLWMQTKPGELWLPPNERKGA